MLDVKVNSEWAPLRVALVHDAGNTTDRPTAPSDERTRAKHPEQGPVRREVFIEQHSRFRRLLHDAGVRLLSPVTQPGAYCQVYTRDPCFVIDDTLYIGRMREAYRQLETAGLAELRRRVAREVVLEQGVIEGGDVMVLPEEVVLVGTGDISDSVGVAALRGCLERRGRKVVRVPHSALHLDCCLAPLPNGQCLYSDARLPEASRDVLRPFFSRMEPLPPEEDLPFLAANIVWLGPGEVVSTSHAPQTNGLLRALGYVVHEVEYSEVIHRWGSVRCTVCPLVRGA